MKYFSIIILAALNPCNASDESGTQPLGDQANIATPIACQNLGFETGDLTGWSKSPAVGALVSVTTTSPQAGTYSVLLTSNANANGIAQTCDAPCGIDTFSFWANITCSASQKTSGGGMIMALSDNTLGMNVASWTKVCTTGLGWQKFTQTGISAQHNYSINFVNQPSTPQGVKVYIDSIAFTSTMGASCPIIDAGSDSSIHDSGIIDSAPEVNVITCGLQTDARNSNPFIQDGQSCIPQGMIGCQCDLDCCTASDSNYYGILPDGAPRYYGTCLFYPDAENYGACE